MVSHSGSINVFQVVLEQKPLLCHNLIGFRLRKDPIYCFIGSYSPYTSVPMTGKKPVYRIVVWPLLLFNATPKAPFFLVYRFHDLFPVPH